MFKKLLLAIAMLSITFPVFALDRPLTSEETDLIQKINAHNTAIKTMAGRFLQIDTVGNRAEGTFFMERPNKVRFKYAPPSREEILSLGKGFYVLDRREKTSNVFAQEQVPLRQFLQEKIDLFSTNIIDVVTTDTHFSVKISDDTPIGIVQVALIFDIATLELAQWVLTEPSGAELTFSLYDVIKNAEIPKSFFFFPDFLLKN